MENNTVPKPKRKRLSWGNNTVPKPKRKRLIWGEEGEVAILDLWEERVTDLRATRKNGHIYAEMANELAKLGHNYTPRDVQVKIANFTQRYRKEKNEMGPSGGSPSMWPFYGRVHQIIGGFKANRFCELMIESIDDSSIESSQSPLSPTSLRTTPQLSSSPSLAPPSPTTPLATPLSPLPDSVSAIEPKKKKSIGGAHKIVMEKFDAISLEISNHMKKNEENEKVFMKIEEEKAASLKELVQDNKELKTGILAFLNRNSEM